MPLMDMGFAVIGLLARHRMPLIRFLYIGSYVCSRLFQTRLTATPLRFATLHLHQGSEGTFTPSGRTCSAHQEKALGLCRGLLLTEPGFKLTGWPGGWLRH